MQFWYKGKRYNVDVVNSSVSSYKIDFDFERFTFTCPKKTVFEKAFSFNKVVNKKASQALEGWYRRQARKELTAKSIFYANKLGVNFNRIAVKDTSTRWGSCSSKGNLNFNYHLIKMPEEVLDYVVIHEVCRLKELNHSKKYWELVKEFCPEYKSVVKWLKENGKQYL